MARRIRRRSGRLLFVDDAPPNLPATAGPSVAVIAPGNLPARARVLTPSLVFGGSVTPPALTGITAAPSSVSGPADNGTQVLVFTPVPPGASLAGLVVTSDDAAVVEVL